jgi:HAD superfamily hydrolase (TIGR01509 family)
MESSSIPNIFTPKLKLIFSKNAMVGKTHRKNITGNFAASALGRTSETIEKKSGAPLPADFPDELKRRKTIAFSTELKSIPHIAETLAKLNVPRCVASNTPLETVKICLRSTGLYNLFTPHIYSAQMVAKGKPSPDLFLYAASEMRFAPKDCIVIEDTLHGVEAARAAGMRVFGFAGGSHCYKGYAEERLKNVELVFSDMRELPVILSKTYR